MENEKIIKEIKEIIETIKMFIQQDGGDLEFIKFEDGFVYIKLLGACVGCAFIDSTYQDGVENILMDQINEVKGIKIVK